jgi:hypothetical protein
MSDSKDKKNPISLKKQRQLELTWLHNDFLSEKVAQFVQKLDKLTRNKVDWFHLSFLAVFLFIFFFLSEYFVAIQREIYHKEYLEAHEKTGFEWPKYSDFWTGIFTVIGLKVLENVVPFFFEDMLNKVCKEQDDLEIKKLRVKKMLSRIKASIFYAISTVSGFYVFSKLDFFPSWMMGNGEEDALKNIYKNFPIYDPETNRLLQSYCSLTFGYHLYSTVTFFLDHLENTRTDFKSMYAHHMSTILLIMVSYRSGFYTMGCLINFVHDWVDTSSQILKALIETRLKTLIIIWAIGNTALWWWSRCYMFPIVAYETLYVYLPTIWTIDGKFDEEKMYIIPYVRLASLLLVVLMILHWFWLTLFFKGFYDSLIGGKLDDPFQIIKKEKKEGETSEGPTEIKNKQL